MTLLNQKDWLLIKIIYTQSNQIQTHPKKKKKKKKKSSQNPLPKVSKSTYPPFYHLGLKQNTYTWTMVKTLSFCFF